MKKIVIVVMLVMLVVPGVIAAQNDRYKRLVLPFYSDDIDITMGDINIDYPTFYSDVVYDGLVDRYASYIKDSNLNGTLIKEGGINNNKNLFNKKTHEDADTKTIKYKFDIDEFHNFNGMEIYKSNFYFGSTLRPDSSSGLFYPCDSCSEPENCGDECRNGENRDLNYFITINREDICDKYSEGNIIINEDGNKRICDGDDFKPITDIGLEEPKEIKNVNKIANIEHEVVRLNSNDLVFCNKRNLGIIRNIDLNSNPIEQFLCDIKTSYDEDILLTKYFIDKCGVGKTGSSQEIFKNTGGLKIPSSLEEYKIEELNINLFKNINRDNQNLNLYVVFEPSVDNFNISLFLYGENNNLRLNNAFEINDYVVGYKGKENKHLAIIPLDNDFFGNQIIKKISFENKNNFKLYSMFLVEENDEIYDQLTCESLSEDIETLKSDLDDAEDDYYDVCENLPFNILLGTSYCKDIFEDNDREKTEEYGFEEEFDEYKSVYDDYMNKNNQYLSLSCDKEINNYYCAGIENQNNGDTKFIWVDDIDESQNLCEDYIGGEWSEGKCCGDDRDDDNWNSTEGVCLNGMFLHNDNISFSNRFEIDKNIDLDYKEKTFEEIGFDINLKDEIIYEGFRGRKEEVSFAEGGDDELDTDVSFIVPDSYTIKNYSAFYITGLRTKSGHPVAYNSSNKFEALCWNEAISEPFGVTFSCYYFYSVNTEKKEKSQYHTNYRFLFDDYVYHDVSYEETEYVLNTEQIEIFNNICLDGVCRYDNKNVEFNSPEITENVFNYERNTTILSKTTSNILNPESIITRGDALAYNGTLYICMGDINDFTEEQQEFVEVKGDCDKVADYVCNPEGWKYEENETESKESPDESSKGCCVLDKCWNGTTCVGADTTYYVGEEEGVLKVCEQGTWKNAARGYGWDRKDWSYVGNKNCIAGEEQEECSTEYPYYKGLEQYKTLFAQNESYLDHYCEGGSWTTRTGKLFYYMKNFSEGQYNPDYFTIQCGKYEDVLSGFLDVSQYHDNYKENCSEDYYISYDVDECQSTLGKNCDVDAVNSFCQMYIADNEGDTINQYIFGTSMNLNVSYEGSDETNGYVLGALGLDDTYCDEKSSYDIPDWEKCDVEDDPARILINEKLNLLMFSNSNIEPVESFIGRVFNYIIDALLSLFTDEGEGEESALINITFMDNLNIASLDLNKVYYRKAGDYSIFASWEKYDEECYLNETIGCDFIIGSVNANSDMYKLFRNNFDNLEIKCDNSNKSCEFIVSDPNKADWNLFRLINIE